jgi:hypothetical protein
MRTGARCGSIVLSDLCRRKEIRQARAETGILCELFRNVHWLFLVIFDSYPDERPSGAYHRIDSNSAPLLDIRDGRNCD